MTGEVVVVVAVAVVATAAWQKARRLGPGAVHGRQQGRANDGKRRGCGGVCVYVCESMCIWFCVCAGAAGGRGLRANGGVVV